MVVTVIKWLIVFLSLTNSGYMLFDGARALTKGDYIRPTSGEYTGQLGPWTKIVERLGIDPMSGFMKSVFVLYGLVGFVLTICFALGYSWAWSALLVFNILCLWNLFFGTMSCTLQIVLLIVWKYLSR
jgi:hypothetical protein